MSTAKYTIFLNNLESFLVKKTNKEIKLAIGDSINNHRVVSVSQVIRFLTRRNATSAQRLLGSQLDTVYELLKDNILINRRLVRGSVRTDAIDINEFIDTYVETVLEGTTTFRKTVSRSLVA